MDASLLWVARLAGLAGVTISLVAGVVRLGGTYELNGFQVLTLLQLGTAVMVLACLAYLASIAERRAGAPRY